MGGCSAGKRRWRRRSHAGRRKLSARTAKKTHSTAAMTMATACRRSCASQAKGFRLGRSPSERTVDCGYPGGGGENIAAGTIRETARSAFELFRDSPSHNANMLDASYRQVGVSRSYHPASRYLWYWTTEFGEIDDGTAPAFASAPGPMGNTGRGNTDLEAVPALPLDDGLNLLTWSGVGLALTSHLPSLPHVTAIYAFEPHTGTWRRWVSGPPSASNSLSRLLPGETYWILAEGVR